ncbi:P-loop containing nucleoside triphosphate hydrolase protein, partial [Dimargaris cristalligena]
MHDKNRGLGNTKSLKDLASDAQSRGQVYNDIHGGSLANDGTRVLVDGALSGRRDNSMRAYYREFRKVVDHADVILEVLDARDPLGCRTKSIERLIMSQATNKRIILVLNKIDLVPRENVEAWLKYLRNEFPTIAFKASTQNQRTRLGQANANTANSDQQVQKSECLGADTLIQLLKNYSRNLNIKTSITVGVIGYPNVGKSSLINSLRRARVCQVGSTPGMTKVAQEIHLDKNVKLLDSPGIVFAKPPNADSSNGKVMADVMLRNCIKVDLLEDPIAPVEAIVARCNIRHLMVLYNVPSFEDTRGFLIHLARQRGRLRHGGLPNMDAAARIVLNDWNTGVIQFYTSPPTQTTTAPMQAAEIVQAWGKEFDLNMV